MSILTTERLTLRPFKEGDADSMFRNWTSDEEVARYCRWYRHKNIDSTRHLLRLYLEEAAAGFEYRWALTPKDEPDNVVGCVDVVGTRDNGTCAELGYVISRSLWGKGLMTEAVTAVIQELFRCGFKRVIARHHTDNPASGRVMEKCGMRYVEMEQEVKKSGGDQLCGVRVYEITSNHE